MSQSQAQKKQEQAAYKKLAQKHQPKPPLLKNMIMAFLVGGAISAVGQAFINYFVAMGMPPDKAGAPAAIVMVFLGALLTGLGVYDSIAKVGGAGAAVPITGFANSIVATAMEFKREGWIMGMSARMFQIAGPVIVYAVVSGVVVGLIRWFLVGVQ